MKKSAQRNSSGHRRAVIHALIGAASFILSATPPAWCQSKTAASAGEKPVVTIEVPSIDRSYQDLKFLFDLAGDPSGYKTLKDTIDVFVTGVETDKPAGYRIFATNSGLQTVASLPVKNEAEFKKFLRNLWDLDVKTAPAPEPAMASKIPAATRTKLQSLKLQPNERLLFGLFDGFLRFDSNTVQVGDTLDTVRLGDGKLSRTGEKGAALTVHVDGDAQPLDQKRAAFEKSKADALSRLKQGKNEPDADFALKKAMVAQQFAKLELLFAETSHFDLTGGISRERKRTEIGTEIVGAKETSLAKDIARIGESPDEFAGVSKKSAVLSGSINAPVNSALGKSLKDVAHQARDVALEKLDGASKIDAADKDTDKGLTNLLFDVIEDVAGMKTYNGFVRTWSNSDGNLTTVGAAAVADTEKYRERLRKFKTREEVHPKEAVGRGVEIHRIHATSWTKDAPELFDKEGSVFIATSDKAIWYAVGEGALEKLERAMHEAHDNSGSKSDLALDLHIQMLPLAEVWDKIDSRQPAKKEAPVKTVTAVKNPKEKVKEKAGEGERPTVAQAASVLAGLHLSKLAVEASKHGHDTMSLTLSRKGDKAIVTGQFDEGSLRFVGLALSKFVKDNLEE